MFCFKVIEISSHIFSFCKNLYLIVFVQTRDTSQSIFGLIKKFSFVTVDLSKSDDKVKSIYPISKGIFLYEKSKLEAST
jgi:hypothetical protein